MSESAPSTIAPALAQPGELLTCTVRAPPHAYAHLAIDGAGNDVDAVQVRAYCAAAMRQFLGIAGAAVPIDVLAVRATDCWIRVPRPDLGAFAAAVTAWAGTPDGCILRLRACSDWLGTLVAADGQAALWRSHPEDEGPSHPAPGVGASLPL